jgi:hypothetical protein
VSRLDLALWSGDGDDGRDGLIGHEEPRNISREPSALKGARDAYAVSDMSLRYVRFSLLET